MVNTLRQWLRISMVLGLVASSLQTVLAESAPHALTSQSIKIVLGYPAGGGADVVLRRLTQNLAFQLGTVVTTEYRPGANGILASTATQQASPDGHTLLLTDPSSLQHYYSQVNDGVRAFVPVSTVAFFHFAVVLNNDFPANNLSEFVSLLQANPGKYSYASPGVGSTGHKIGEMLQQAGQVQLNHIPYKGGSQMLIDLVGGQVPIGILSLPAAMSYAHAKRVKILAVTSRDRTKLLPQVPALTEKWPKVHGGSALFLVAPPNPPEAIVTQLNQAVREAMDTPDVHAEFAAKGVEIKLSSARELAQLIREEVPAVKELARTEKSSALKH